MGLLSALSVVVMAAMAGSACGTPPKGKGTESPPTTVVETDAKAEETDPEAADPPEAADAKEEASPADVAAFLGFFDQVMHVALADKDDCDKMAADINALVAANQDALARARAAQADNKKLPAEAKTRMRRAIKKATPGLEACGNHEKVKAAFNSIEMGSKP